MQRVFRGLVQLLAAIVLSEYAVGVYADLNPPTSMFSTSMIVLCGGLYNTEYRSSLIKCVLVPSTQDHPGLRDNS